MKKILKILKDKELDALILILLCLSVTFVVLVNCYDELWNFANCYKMFNGYKIYEELNVIVTPLFFYISQIFFKVFGATILSFRIYNIIICTTFFMLIYFIFKSLKIVRRRAIFYTFVMLFVFMSMIVCGASYNMLAIIPILIAILLIFNGKENTISFGILLFITFMLKQNIFVYFAIGIFLYKLIKTKKVKNLITDLFKIYSVSFLGIFIFLLYLYIDNNLYNFINYCFLGISEFGSNNLAIEVDGARFLYIAIIVIIFSLIIIYNKKINKNVDEETVKNTKTLLSFGIPLLLISFPIINYYHATLASVIIIIEGIYIIENILIKHLEIDRKKEKIIYIVLIALYIIYIYATISCETIKTSKGKTFFNNNGALYGSIITKEDYEDIQTICWYIKEQEKNGINVKVLSYKANLYMTELNKNNGIFDLAFLGNLGAEGEQGLINKIKNLKNTIILIQSDEEKMFWQESKNARNYIINNYEELGKIKDYSVFYIK